MKNKLSFSLVSRWVFAPLLVGSLVAWGVSPAYSGNNQNAEASHATPKQAVNGVPEKAANDSNADVQEIKDRIKELEAKERQNYAMVLEGQYKKIDWWLNFLAVILGLLAILVPVAGIAIPYFMVRRDKEVIEQDKAQIKQWKAEIENLKVVATSDADTIHKHVADVADAKKTMMSFTSGASSAEEKEKITEAVATVEKDKESDYILRLRAEAITASQAKDAVKAYALWNALITLAPSDASTQINAGYWAQELGENAEVAEKQHWLKLAGKHYAQAINLKPDMHKAAYNWGNALADGAEAVSTKDLASARALWNQAGEKYQQALDIRPDKHEAANNWGGALADEASAVAAQDLASARTLWKQAGEKYQQALLIKPDVHDPAFNWGVVLAAEARAVSAQDLACASVLWKQAGEKYQQALVIKPNMYEALINWGGALAAEASAVAAQDLASARTLWKQAGEKYQQALVIKPDMPEAANNWGNALAAEANAVVVQELASARALWEQAGEKYRLALSIKPDDRKAANNWAGALAAEARALAMNDTDESKRLLDKMEQLLLAHADAASGFVSYNLACMNGLRGDVQQCLHWLKISQTHNTLPDCPYLRNDKDLDAVRNSPEFIAWLATVCDDKSAQDSGKDKSA